MEYASIFMLIFAGVILFYALILALTKDIKLIPRNYAVKTTNKRNYAVKFAKILMFVSIAPALTGIIGLLTDSAFFMVIALIAGFIIFIRLGIKYSRIRTNGE